MGRKKYYISKLIAIKIEEALKKINLVRQELAIISNLSKSSARNNVRHIGYAQANVTNLNWYLTFVIFKTD